MKNKKIKIIVILIITLIIGLLGYSQVIPIIVKKPSEDFTPISIKEAKISQDNNMALSFLYNITKGGFFYKFIMIVSQMTLPFYVSYYIIKYLQKHTKIELYG